MDSKRRRGCGNKEPVELKSNFHITFFITNQPCFSLNFSTARGYGMLLTFLQLLKDQFPQEFEDNDLTEDDLDWFITERLQFFA